MKLQKSINFCQSINRLVLDVYLMGWILPNLWTALPGSCSGQSSASSRRHAAVYRHWSSSSLALASVSGHFLLCHKWAINSVELQHNVENGLKMQEYQQEKETWQLSQRSCLFSLNIPQGGCVLCVLCVPAVVFTNSPQQNLPIGCPGLAKLPNSISFLWESDGLASWYSERQKEDVKNPRRQQKMVITGVRKSSARRVGI